MNNVFLIPETKALYDQLLDDNKIITGRIIGDDCYFAEPDETLEIIPEYDKTGFTWLVSCQTLGTWNPFMFENICIDDITDIKIVKSWKID